MSPHLVLRRTISVMLVIAAAAVAVPARDVHAGCNLIPPAEQTFPSTLGTVVSPITAPGRTVEIRLSPCDASPGFDAVVANNVVTLTFQPPAGAPTAVPIGAGVSVADCVGADCGVLRFVVPDTTGLLPPDGLAGPAEITVVRGATPVAVIGPLYQPRPSVTACTNEPEIVFEHFGVLPTPNDFADLSSGAATQVLATLDGGGNLLIPFDYVDVLPLGPGAPVARLVSGFATLDAFTSNPGTPIVVPDTTFARSFTVDGRPLPPLLRADAAGTSVFGTTDAAQAILRIARTDGEGGPPIYDLSDRLSNAGRGPIVITMFSTESREAIPLANLQSSATGVAYTRDESLEGNLNAASGDTDTDDRIVQILDAATGASTSTEMAAADPRSPIYGPAAVTTAGEIVAFLESEADQNATDLDGDGDARDAVLRVFDLTGSEITPGPTFVADPFTVINRKPLAISDDLVFFREPQPGLSRVTEILASIGKTGGSIVTSADGRFVIATSTAFSTLHVGYRDAETGVAAAGGPVADDQLGTNLTGIGGASGMVVSPDSRFLYVAGPSDSAVQTASISLDFEKDAHPTSFGTDVEFDGVGGVDGLAGVSRLAVSPDGAHLYASGTGEDAIAVFVREPVTGSLSFVESHFDGVGGVTGLDEPRGLAVSPDGDHVYVAASASNAVTAFARDAGTGALTFVATYGDGGLGGPALGGVREVVVSADGLNVYVVADGDSALSVFSRDAVTGMLTFLEAHVDGVSGVGGLAQARSLAIAPDAQTVYAGGGGYVAVFNRELPGGGLTFVEGESNNGDETLGLAVSADSQNVYALYRTAFGEFTYIGSWQRNGRLRAFDTATASLRIGLGNEPATLAAVAAGRAVFISNEGYANGSDLNGDLDTVDHLVYAYDATTDTVTRLDGASAFYANRVALSARTLALSLPESLQQPPSDLNGNGQADDVLAILATDDLEGAPTVVPVSVNDRGLAATDVCEGGDANGGRCVTDADCPAGACQGVVVFGSYEMGRNLLGDPEIFSEIIGVYRTSTGQVTYVPYHVIDFSVGGNVIAFRTFELHDQLDLNGDGDTVDAILMLYSLEGNVLINTGQAIVRCDLPGCTPGLPYKILGDQVAFLTDEAEQGGRDLDGDGLTNGIVAQVFDVRKARRQVFSVPEGAPSLPPLPEDFIGSPVLYREVHESDVGVDVNQDGDLDDVVNLVTGDNDGDGVFNENDTCVETADDDARDSDLDGLGDVCDPTPFCSAYTPLDVPLAPAANAKCQQALGKAARGYLASRANTIRGCLADLAKGKKTGSAVALCVGALFREQENPPADAKTAAKLAKARAKLDKTIAGACAPADLDALDPCATSVAGAQRCLADRITSGVEAALGLAYGDVSALTDKAALKCQQAIGTSTVGYLKAASTAMVKCLDARNAGVIAGDGQVLCLGAGDPTGVVAPADLATAGKVAKAEAKLRKALDTKCTDALLATLDTCGATRDAVGDCLACTGWRRVVEALRGAYGVP